MNRQLEAFLSAFSAFQYLGHHKIGYRSHGHLCPGTSLGQKPSNRCDWGTLAAPAFASSISSDIVNVADTLIAVFDAGFSETALVIKPTGNSLHVETYDRFKDNSGRSNYLASYAFQKAHTPGEVIPGAVPTPIDLTGVWNCDDGGKYYVRLLETRSGGMESLIQIRRTGQIL